MMPHHTPPRPQGPMLVSDFVPSAWHLPKQPPLAKSCLTRMLDAVATSWGCIPTGTRGRSWARSCGAGPCVSHGAGTPPAGTAGHTADRRWRSSPRRPRLRSAQRQGPGPRLGAAMLRQGRTTATRAVAEPVKCVLHCLLCVLQQQVCHSAALAAAEPAVMPAASWRVWLLLQNLLIAAQSGVGPAVREGARILEFGCS